MSSYDDYDDYNHGEDGYGEGYGDNEYWRENEDEYGFDAGYGDEEEDIQDYGNEEPVYEHYGDEEDIPQDYEEEEAERQGDHINEEELGDIHDLYDDNVNGEEVQDDYGDEQELAQEDEAYEQDFLETDDGSIPQNYDELANDLEEYENQENDYTISQDDDDYDIGDDADYDTGDDADYDIGDDADLVYSCNGDAQYCTENIPQLSVLPTSDYAYNDVSDRFRRKWLHALGAAPDIHMIWKIHGTEDMNQRFHQYVSRIQNQRAGVANIRFRFHGTMRLCQLGDALENSQLCPQPDCSLCNIIRTSFQLERAQSNIMFGRFGRGIYTTGTSSKANDYVRESRSVGFKAMLLNQVVMGRVIRLYEDDVSLIAPPYGYDSVVGEPGGSLNYDEAIVYDNDAIRPVYLIIYRC